MHRWQRLRRWLQKVARQIEALFAKSTAASLSLMKHRYSIVCQEESHMQALGASLALCLPVGALLTLQGELGAGKSVLARAIIHALGFSGRVKSPTYTLLETYTLKSPQTDINSVAHFDLYRIADPQELYYLGFDDVLAGHDLVMIEWPQRATGLLPDESIAITITYGVESMHNQAGVADSALEVNLLRQVNIESNQLLDISTMPHG